jgi:hypothetical protein
MTNPLQRLQRLAREDPDTLNAVTERIRRLSDGETARIKALCEADRETLFRLMYRDNASVEVAEAALRDGDLGY